MKNLKKILDEAISDNTRNKMLAPYRRAAKAGMSDKAAGYVGLLEILLDELSDTTKMNDKEFKQKVERYGARSKLVASYVKKETLPLDSAEVEADVEQEEPEAEPEGGKAEPMTMKSVLPDDEIDVSPAGLGGKSPGGPPPPIPKGPEKLGGEEKPEELPSLKTLAKKELGGEDSPEEPKTGSKKKVSKLGKAIQKSTEIKQIRLSKQAVEKTANYAQSWKIGQVVQVGFTTGLTVVGGNRKTGWILKKGDKSYLFVPSRNPKLGRGLYALGDKKKRKS
jgi:hypothetical protein